MVLGSEQRAAVRKRRGLFSSIVALVCVAAILVYVIQPQLPQVQSKASMQADAAALERDVRQIVTAFGPRDFRNPQNLDRVAAYIREQFAATGARVVEQPFTVNGATYRNVIASFGPEQGELIVVGAHYDTAGPAPGADDNASGVAGLLELARLPRVSISSR